MRKLYKPVYDLWISVMWWMPWGLSQYVVVVARAGPRAGGVPALAPSRPLG